MHTPFPVAKQRTDRLCCRAYPEPAVGPVADSSAERGPGVRISQPCSRQTFSVVSLRKDLALFFVNCTPSTPSSHPRRNTSLGRIISCSLCLGRTNRSLVRGVDFLSETSFFTRKAVFSFLCIRLRPRSSWHTFPAQHTARHAFLQPIRLVRPPPCPRFRRHRCSARCPRPCFRHSRVAAH